MVKSTFMALMALFLCLSAQAGSYVRTHDDFVHLSVYEKNQLIIKTMELVVALESQYSYEVKKYGFNSERFEKFSKAVSKVKAILFMDSAYAAASSKKPMTDWNSYGNAFKTLMSKDGSNCVFAGWPSKPYVLPGTNNTYCGHPDFIQSDLPNRHSLKEMAAWTQYYPDPKPDSGCGINDRKKILCNPAIFGFKNASKGDLFCVVASDGAHNSAYNCMQEALKERPADGVIDPPATRLAALRTSLDGNRDAFKAIQEFAYKTCVCDSSPKNFNSAYQTYIRKHRTCYGMMEMMAAVSCGSQTPLMDTSIFESLREYAKDKIIYNSETNTDETMVDHHYEMFIKNVVQVKAKDEYNLLCKGIAKPEVVAKEYECTKATCKAVVTEAGASTFSCSTFAINVKGSNPVETVTLDEAPSQSPSSDTERTLAITGMISGASVSLSCPLEFTPADAVPKKYTCSKAECKTIAAVAPATDTTFECRYEVHEEGKPTPLATFSTEPVQKPAAGDVQTESAQLPITGKIGEVDVSLSCPLTILPVVVEEEPEVVDEKKYECQKAECSAASAVAATNLAGIAGGSETTAAAAFTCSIVANEKDKTEKISLSSSPEGTPVDGADSKFKVTIAEKEVELSCKVSMKKADVPAKIEPKPTTARPSVTGPAPANQGPPRPQIRGASDTSAVGIK